MLSVTERFFLLLATSGYIWHLILLVAVLINIELLKSDNIDAVKEIKNLHFLNFWCDLYNILIGLGVFCFGWFYDGVDDWFLKISGLACAIINIAPTLSFSMPTGPRPAGSRSERWCSSCRLFASPSLLCAFGISQVSNLRTSGKPTACCPSCLAMFSQSLCSSWLWWGTRPWSEAGNLRRNSCRRWNQASRSLWWINWFWKKINICVNYIVLCSDWCNDLTHFINLNLSF